MRAMHRSIPARKTGSSSCARFPASAWRWGGHDLARIRLPATVIVSQSGYPPDAPPLWTHARWRADRFGDRLRVSGARLRPLHRDHRNQRQDDDHRIGGAPAARRRPARGGGRQHRTPARRCRRCERDPYQWLVVEASSFQLHDSPNFHPAIGIITNLAPDHLDRYASVEAYYADKARLFSNATPSNIWVLNGEDEAVRALPGSAPGERRYFRTDRVLDAGEQVRFLRR